MRQAEARARLSEEIERSVIGAVRRGSIVRTGYIAGILADAYADAGFSVGHIVDAIADAASRRGVPVEIARPKDAVDSKALNAPLIAPPFPRVPKNGAL
jgi:hypothetical protein